MSLFTLVVCFSACYVQRQAYYFTTFVYGCLQRKHALPIRLQSSPFTVIYISLQISQARPFAHPTLRSQLIDGSKERQTAASSSSEFLIPMQYLTHTHAYSTISHAACKIYSKLCSCCLLHPTYSSQHRYVYPSGIPLCVGRSG